MKKDRLVDRAVLSRTLDNLAVLQDLPRGQNQLATAFPVPPAFDALSEFTFSWHADRHLAISTDIRELRPWTYPDVTKQSGADVVVVGLRYFSVHYAPDSSNDPTGVTHLTIRPYQFLVNQSPKNDIYWSDVYVNNGTGLPTEIRMAGNDDLTFIVDYAMIENHWLVNHAHFEQTVFGPLHIGAIHFVAEATYDQFSFPSAAPDPRLVTPSPTPTPTPLPGSTGTNAPAPAPALTPAPTK